ncbi:hypothetical protein EWM64_g2702 [Hericium alpestre]|uniref:Uncharacterized protein n=1 Tax=Hericium alpestre TaxID=135208 RepID=A0A4Z0A4C4_9AGAM|nr:hypothetical protein EWM64_g2702 [Hericium alpestre]
MVESLLAEYEASIVRLPWRDEKPTKPRPDVVRSPLSIPSELLRKIILHYLADSFFDLIVEPDLEVHWDPLSPLMHASFYLREVTDNLLQPIIGKPVFRFSDFKRATNAMAVMYLCMLGDLEFAKSSALLLDPKELLDPELCIAPPADCESPILWHARAFMLQTWYLRLIDVLPNVREDLGEDMPEQLGDYVQQITDLAMSTTDEMPPSVREAVFDPIQAQLCLSAHLIQRTRMLRRIGIYALAPSVLGADVVMEGMKEADMSLADERKTIASASAHMARLHLDPDGLPIPQALLDAFKVDEAWIALQAHLASPEDGPVKQFCGRVRDHLVAALSAEQRSQCLPKNGGLILHLRRAMGST